MDLDTSFDNGKRLKTLTERPRLLCSKGPWNNLMLPQSG